MKDELIKLKNKLQVDRKSLLDKLQSIDDNITSIDKVLSLVDVQKTKSDDKQLSLSIKPLERKSERLKSNRFENITFYEAIETLFKENPEKLWKASELTDLVIREGFTHNSKNFKNTARTLLLNMRKANRIGATQTKGGWLYGGTKKDPVSLTGETGSLDNNGGLPE